MLEQIRDMWGGEVPELQWFDMGNVREVSPAQIQELVAMFFPGKVPGAGDLQIHESYIVSGMSCLRVRGATKLVLVVRLSGLPEWPLYRVEHPNDPRRRITFTNRSR